MAVKTMRTSQGGSVVSFLVVGIVLVVLVGGGIFLLQHRNTAHSPSVAKTSTSPVAAPSSSVAPTNAPAPSPSSSPQPSPSKTPGVSQPSPSKMPATGPADLMPYGIVLAVLVGCAAEVVQSFRVRGLNR